MNIAVISMYNFPTGMAASNRILAYVKGLMANGANVTVLLPFPETSKQNYGYFDGIRYISTYGRKKSKYKIIRGIAKVSQYRQIRALVNIFLCMVIRHKISYDFIIASTDTISHLLCYTLIAKLLESKIIFIADEYPIPIRHKLKEKIPFWKTSLYKFVLKRFDGYIFISEALSRFYNNICKKPTYILGVIIDTSRFENIENKDLNSKQRYLCYMGNMELAKDNVDLIIKSFSYIAKEFPDINLYLYGEPNTATINYLQKLINELGLGERIYLQGKANYEEVPIILHSAEILLASQPNTKRASGGFPTKLGEYLLSEKPAIFTRVGENDKYVIENKHVFFVEPENMIEYANKMRYILQNYSSSVVIAKQGRQYVEDNYSYIIVGKELYNFLKSLKI